MTGSSFATFSAPGGKVPIERMALILILGVDGLMHEACTITNFIGNGKATIVMATGKFAMTTGCMPLRRRTVRDRVHVRHVRYRRTRLRYRVSEFTIPQAETTKVSVT